MVLEQGVSIQTEGKSLLAVREIGQEALEIFFIQEDALSSVPPCDDVIESPWKMDSGFSSHDHSV